MRTRRARKFRQKVLAVLGLVAISGASLYFTISDLTFETAQAKTVVQHATRPQATYRGALRHGGIPLETLLNAEDRLDDVKVRNSHGDPVGFVRAVQVGPGGRPERVQVGFGGFLGIGGSTVPIKADKLGYDPKHNIVLTDMTMRQLAIIAARRDRQPD